MKTNPRAGAAINAPIQEIRIDAIVPDPRNRKDHDPAKIALLAAEIEAVGLMQPIVLRPIDDNDTLFVKTQRDVNDAKFVIIAGERRWEAHRHLGRETIPARVFENLAARDVVRQRAAENFHREDLSPIERAQVLEQMFAAGWSQAEVASFVGAKDQSTVSNLCRLLRLPEKVRKLVHEGTLSRAHGVALVPFARWPKVCEYIAAVAVENERTSKDLEGKDLPYAYDLKHMGLVIQIETQADYYGNRPAYIVPPALVADPDFIVAKHSAWCFAPEKWAPEKAKQDAAFAEKKKKGAAREGAKQSKMTPSEAAARAKKIADNKRARREGELAHEAAMGMLAATKDVDAAQVAVVVLTALEAHWKIGKVADAVAKRLGITLPKGFGTLEGFAKLKPADMIRLVAGCIVQQQSELSSAGAHGIAEEVAHVLGEKKVAAVKSEAMVLAAVAKVQAKAPAKPAPAKKPKPAKAGKTGGAA